MRARAVVPGKLGIDGLSLELAACAECEACFQPRSPSAAALEAHYEYMGHHPEIALLSPFLERRLERVVDRIEPFRREARLLEVGCAGGLLLRVAERRGWQVHGSEVSASCARLLKPWLGERLHHGDVVDAPFPLESFDAVVMLEVIEHLPDPGAYLRAAYSLLRPGGCLLLTTPNFDGFSGRLLGARWRVVTDEHLTYFAPRSIERLLLAVGFTGVRVHRAGIDLAPWFARFRRRLVRHEEAPPPRVDVTRRASSSLKPLVADFAIELGNHVLDLFRLGDSLKVLAVKRARGEA